MEGGPSEFLEKANTDPELSGRILEALERGGTVVADEVQRIAEEAGYSFSQVEFQEEVRRSISDRFAAGEQHLASAAEAPPRPPMSSCQVGCLSYTVNWHPKVS